MVALIFRLRVAPIAVAVLLTLTPVAAESVDYLTPEDAITVNAVNNYLNGITDLEGDFTQTGPDGSVSEGRFYIRRPGRARFEYAAPNRLLVIADGFWIGVQDDKLKTTDRYPIGSTPYWTLLKEEVDLGSDARILSVQREPGLILVAIDDPSGEAAGELTLIFEEALGDDQDATAGSTITLPDGPDGIVEPFVPLRLAQWLVTDAQGLTTSVTVSNLVEGQRARNNLFVIRDAKR